MRCPSCSLTATPYRTAATATTIRRWYVCDQQHQFATEETVTTKTRVDRRQITRLFRQARDVLDEMEKVAG
jgi:transcriptional regulator NrdR family protein